MSLTSYRAAPSRDTRLAYRLRCLRPGSVILISFREKWAFTRFGGDLLSRGLSPSTIGAAVLNFRVRDGTGCFTCAMTTKPRKSPCRLSCCARKRQVAGSVFACECALPLGCSYQSTPCTLRSRVSRAGGSVFVYECAFPRLSHPWSRSVYALVLSFHYWIKSSLSGD